MEKLDTLDEKLEKLDTLDEKLEKQDSLDEKLEKQNKVQALCDISSDLLPVPDSSFATCTGDSTFYSCVDESMSHDMQEVLHTSIEHCDLERTLVSSTPNRTALGRNSSEAYLGMDLRNLESAAENDGYSEQEVTELSETITFGEQPHLERLDDSLNNIINEGIEEAARVDRSHIEGVVDFNVSSESDDLNMSTESANLDISNNGNDGEISFPNNVHDVQNTENGEEVKSSCSILRKESSLDVLDEFADKISDEILFLTEQQDNSGSVFTRDLGESISKADSSIDILQTTSSIHVIGSSEQLNTVNRIRNSLSDEVTSIRSSVSSISVLGTSSQSNNIPHLLEGCLSDENEKDMEEESFKETSMIESCETVLTCVYREPDETYEQEMSANQEDSCSREPAVSKHTTSSFGNRVCQTVNLEAADAINYETKPNSEEGVAVSLASSDTTIEDLNTPMSATTHSTNNDQTSTTSAIFCSNQTVDADTFLELPTTEVDKNNVLEEKNTSFTNAVLDSETIHSSQIEVLGKSELVDECTEQEKELTVECTEQVNESKVGYTEIDNKSTVEFVEIENDSTVECTKTGTESTIECTEIGNKSTVHSTKRINVSRVEIDSTYEGGDAAINKISGDEATKSSKDVSNDSDKNMYPEVLIKPVLQIDPSDIEILGLVEPIEYSSSVESTPHASFEKVRTQFRI